MNNSKAEEYAFSVFFCQRICANKRRFYIQTEFELQSTLVTLWWRRILTASHLGIQSFARKFDRGVVIQPTGGINALFLRKVTLSLHTLKDFPRRALICAAISTKW